MKSSTLIRVLTLAMLLALLAVTTPVKGQVDPPESIFGTALAFDGDDDFVYTTMFNTLTEVTMEAWIKADDVDDASRLQVIMDNGGGGGGADEVQMYVWDGNVYASRWFGNGGRASAPIESGTWYHIAATITPESVTLYMNGDMVDSFIGSGSFVRPPQWPYPYPRIESHYWNWIIGSGRHGEYNMEFDGTLDEVRVWDTALDETTIASWMSRELDASHPNDGNLIGYWNFNEGSGTTAADTSGHGNHATLHNMDPATAWVPVGDIDTDNDSVPDSEDNCVDVPNPSQEDYDTDGQGDACDDDDDNDGYLDVDDAFPLDETEWLDTDGDGTGDNADPDDDNDGYNDDVDAFPYDPTEWADSDGDGYGDNADPDDDNDGVADVDDAFPYDPTEWADSDGDGYGDNSDAFPNDPTEWADSDGDGYGENSDAFPTDPTEWADSDGDGVGDNGDAFPHDPTEWADSDGDGAGDNGDNCPAVANADQTDFDLDGAGDACDPDDDNDGVADGGDLCFGTLVPESVPTEELKPNNYALVDGDDAFDTVVKGKGKGPEVSFTLADTGGCSCEQIIAAVGLGGGHTKHGCAVGEMEAWVEAVP